MHSYQYHPIILAARTAKTWKNTFVKCCCISLLMASAADHASETQPANTSLAKWPAGHFKPFVKVVVDHVEMEYLAG